MKDKILEILKEEAPLIDWSIEDWPYSENTFWVIGKITIKKYEIIGDCVLGEGNVLDNEGEIIDKDIYPIFDLTGPGYTLQKRERKTEWIEATLATIGYQLEKKLIGQYNHSAPFQELLDRWAKKAGRRKQAGNGVAD